MMSSADCQPETHIVELLSNSASFVMNIYRSFHPTSSDLIHRPADLTILVIF
jgi:hypothetical protein